MVGSRYHRDRQVERATEVEPVESLTRGIRSTASGGGWRRLRGSRGGSGGEARNPAGEPLKVPTRITSFGFVAWHDCAKAAAYGASVSDPHAPGWLVRCSSRL